MSSLIVYCDRNANARHSTAERANMLCRSLAHCLAVPSSSVCMQLYRGRPPLTVYGPWQQAGRQQSPMTPIYGFGFAVGPGLTDASR